MQRGRRGGPVTREAAAAAAAAAAARETPPQVVKVKREVVAGCMTCPVCHKLLSEATTISECLHTCESSSLSWPIEISGVFGGFLVGGGRVDGWYTLEFDSFCGFS